MNAPKVGQFGSCQISLIGAIQNQLLLRLPYTPPLLTNSFWAVPR